MWHGSFTTHGSGVMGTIVSEFGTASPPPELEDALTSDADLLKYSSTPFATLAPSTRVERKPKRTCLFRPCCVCVHRVLVSRAV